MSDLIDRQAAIDALHAWEMVYTWDETCLENREIVYAPSEVIEDLPDAEPEPQWIPCSERLPEENGLYLVTTSKGQVQVHVFNRNSEEYWMRCNKAWMPMPEAYGGEEDE